MLPDFAAMVRDRFAASRRVDHWVKQALGSVVPDLLTRQLEPDSRTGERHLSASSMGKCIRANWAKKNGWPNTGRELDARSHTVFAYGDIIEAMVTAALVDQIGWLSLDPRFKWRIEQTVLDGVQREVSLDLAGTTITGHTDGVLFVWDNPPGPFCVLEVKSITGYALLEIEKRLAAGLEGWGPDESYWWQHQTYLHAEGYERGYVICVAKEVGVTIGFWIEKDSETYLHAAENVVHWVHGDTMPPRQLPDGTILTPRRLKRMPKGLSTAGKLPWQCSYCSYGAQCWGERFTWATDRDFRGRASKRAFITDYTEGEFDHGY